MRRVQRSIYPDPRGTAVQLRWTAVRVVACRSAAVFVRHTGTGLQVIYDNMRALYLADVLRSVSQMCYGVSGGCIVVYLADVC